MEHDATGGLIWTLSERREKGILVLKYPYLPFKWVLPPPPPDGGAIIHKGLIGIFTSINSIVGQVGLFYNQKS